MERQIEFNDSQQHTRPYLIVGRHPCVQRLTYWPFQLVGGATLQWRRPGREGMRRLRQERHEELDVPQVMASEMVFGYDDETHAFPDQRAAHLGQQLPVFLQKSTWLHFEHDLQTC